MWAQWVCSRIALYKQSSITCERNESAQEQRITLYKWSSIKWSNEIVKIQTQQHFACTHTHTHIQWYTHTEETFKAEMTKFYDSECASHFSILKPPPPPPFFFKATQSQCLPLIWIFIQGQLQKPSLQPFFAPGRSVMDSHSKSKHGLFWPCCCPSQFYSLCNKGSETTENIWIKKVAIMSDLLLVNLFISALIDLCYVLSTCRFTQPKI